MFISKKHLPRRTFLRNAGVSISVPLLDAMIPAATALAQTAAVAPPRMGFFYFPHGAVMDNWTPEQSGNDFELKSILQPLNPFKDKLTIVSGLENKRAYGPVHAITPGTWLTGESPRVSHDPFGGITIDQIAARQISQDTPLPSIEVSTEATGSTACDRDYGCSYGSTISFRTPSTPLPMENNPRKLFQTLFGVGDSVEERAAISLQTGSVLDQIMSESRQLQSQLGAADRTVLSDYLESVREIERRIQKTAAHDMSGIVLPDAPLGIPSDFDEHINLQMDLIAMAWQAGMTRVASMMFAAEVSNKTYNHIGISDAFHPLSHHQNNPAKIARLLRVQEYHSRVFARFVQRLADTPDLDGSMLDNSILLYGSNMSNSNAHNHFPLPSVIVGTGGGRIKGGQHLVYPDYTPVSNLMLTLMDRIGVEMESFGDSTGRFAEV
ncbi:MAG: hypothetical protein COA71_12625 [SAR86 cluster bacterium]|uniref:DUF1552 domain-containing protein n=1 Tax=SAR86 cluster bacterium TaxID=2030880 RepID=A0A2A5C870_9GAMM|nr:MAG: hypothetical protein COA71_12625 [SAR86 cluster bacterium]